MHYVNEPTPGSLADLQDEADPEQVARTILLRRLTAAPRTRLECLDDLRKRGIPPEVAQCVVDRFVEVGLIDDAEYARMWAQSRHRAKGSAPSVLRRQLRAKGIDDDAVRDALAPIDSAAERQRAKAMVIAKLPALARFDSATQQRRLVSMLGRRGYSQGLSFAVVREVLDESGSTGDSSNEAFIDG